MDWIQLVKLYRALGEEDIMKGIFEKEIAKQQIS
jgi:hypothetical protein